MYLSNSNARRKANINAKKFDQLMQDIEKDVGRRTKNSKNLDIWTNKLGSYINTNPFTTGGVKHAEMVGLLENVMSEAKFKGLARGGTAELVKGVISENTMHYVTRMGDDMKNNLRKIAVDAYNQNMNPHQIAKKLQDEVQGLSKTRAKAIARTETMRANNLSNYVNAKLNMGAKSYKVISASDCCERCDRIYKNGKVWFDIDDLEYFPPLHPNCRCVVVFSTRTAAENNIGLNLDYQNEIKSFQNKTYNLNHEVATIFDNKGKKLLEMHKGNENRVLFPKNVINIGKNKGLGLSIHNHPSQVAIPSKGDIKNFLVTNTKYGVVTGKNDLSITTIKDYKLGNKKIDAILGSYSIGMKNIKNEFIKNNSSIVKKIQNQYFNDPIKLNNELSKEFEKYALKNHAKIVKQLNNEINRYGIDILLM